MRHYGIKSGDVCEAELGERVLKDRNPGRVAGIRRGGGGGVDGFHYFVDVGRDEGI